MLSHQITLEEFRNYKGELTLASESNCSGNKRLYATWIMSMDCLLFHITSSGAEEYVTASFEDAITEYNKRTA